jgi:hypothetical protein
VWQTSLAAQIDVSADSRTETQQNKNQESDNQQGCAFISLCGRCSYHFRRGRRKNGGGRG